MLGVSKDDRVWRRGKDASTRLYFRRNGRIVVEERFGIKTRQFSLTCDEDSYVSDVASAQIIMDKSDAVMPLKENINGGKGNGSILDQDLSLINETEFDEGAHNFIFEPLVLHGALENAVAIAANKRISFYMEGGRTYESFFDAPIKRIWPTTVGLLVETSLVNETNSKRIHLRYLFHPLKPPLLLGLPGESAAELPNSGSLWQILDTMSVGNQTLVLKADHDSGHRLHMCGFVCKETSSHFTLQSLCTIPLADTKFRLKTAFLSHGFGPDVYLINVVYAVEGSAKKRLQATSQKVSVFAFKVNFDSFNATEVSHSLFERVTGIFPHYTHFGLGDEGKVVSFIHEVDAAVGFYCFENGYRLECCTLAAEELISLNSNVLTYRSPDSTKCSKVLIPSMHTKSRVITVCLQEVGEALSILYYKLKLAMPKLDSWLIFFNLSVEVAGAGHVLWELHSLTSTHGTKARPHSLPSAALEHFRRVIQSIAPTEPTLLLNGLKRAFNKLWLMQDDAFRNLEQLGRLIYVLTRHQVPESASYYKLFWTELPRDRSDGELCTSDVASQLICAFKGGVVAKSELNASGAFTALQVLRSWSNYVYLNENSLDRKQWISVLNTCARGLNFETVANLPLALSIALDDMLQWTSTEEDLSSASPGTLLLLKRYDWLFQLYNLRFPPAWHSKFSSGGSSIPSDILNVLEKVDKAFAAPKIGTFGRPDQSTSRAATLEDEILWLSKDEFNAKRFSKDLRLWEAYRMLCGSRTYALSIPAHVRERDEEFQDGVIQSQLRNLAERVWAGPMGRAALSYAVLSLLDNNPVASLPVNATNATFKWTPSLRAAAQWADFHQGVAAALKLAPSTKGSKQLLPEGWLAMQRSQNGKDAVHGGFLLGLGLNNHLEAFDNFEIYRYLTERHIPIMVGCVLGLAVSQRGTCNPYLTQTAKCDISVFVAPSFREEIQLQHTRQITSMVSLGWLYCGTAQRNMSDSLLEQLLLESHLANDVTSIQEQDEHFLVAGLSLGLVFMGEYVKSTGASSLSTPSDCSQSTEEQLSSEGFTNSSAISKVLQLVQGVVDVDASSDSAYSSLKFAKLVHRQALSGTPGKKPVASVGQRSGAALALALAYLKSDNKHVADFLKVPGETNVRELDTMRLDSVSLFVLARLLILWSQIEPHEAFIKSQIPTAVQGVSEYALSCAACGFASCKLCDFECPACHESSFILPESWKEYEEDVTICYYSCVSGAALALGIKFAGTNDVSCRILLTRWLQKMQAHFDRVSQAKSAPCNNVLLTNCRNSFVLALALVLAGTGDVDLLRILRRWHYTLDGSISYSTRLVTQLAVGWLFLGNGSWTFASTTGEQIAGLLCSVLPFYPADATDCTFFFPALRHFWALAVQPRCFVTRNVHTHELESLSITVTKRSNEGIVLKTPCILPPIHTIDSIVVCSDEAGTVWPVRLKMTPDTVSALVKHGYVWFVQMRPGMEYTSGTDTVEPGLNRPLPFNRKYFFPKFLSSAATNLETELWTRRVLRKMADTQGSNLVLVGLVSIVFEVCLANRQYDLLNQMLPIFADCLSEGRLDFLPKLVQAFVKSSGTPESGCDKIMTDLLLEQLHILDAYRAFPFPHKFAFKAFRTLKRKP